MTNPPIVCLALAVLGLMGRTVCAQTPLPRFEVGVHLTNVRFSGFDPNIEYIKQHVSEFPIRLYISPQGIWQDQGIGLSISYNIRRSLAIEAETTYLPSRVDLTDRGWHGRRKVQYWLST